MFTSKPYSIVNQLKDFDVAVMKIKDTFNGHPNIRPVILANERCLTCGGMRVRLSGWGRNENGIFPEELHEIQQYILDNDECYIQWGGDITSRCEERVFYLNSIFDLFMKIF